MQLFAFVHTPPHAHSFTTYTPPYTTHAHTLSLYCCSTSYSAGTSSLHTSHLMERAKTGRGAETHTNPEETSSE